MVVIYHNNCNDGFCAAWLLSKLYPDAKFIPMNYAEPPPVVDGEDVIIADFSFKRDILLDMKSKAKSLLVLDHHKTAQADLEGLDFCIFDMNKSGARLVAEFYRGNFPGNHNNSWLVHYTEDRDLWLWKLPHSKEVNAALASYERNFKIWDELYFKQPIPDILDEGAAIIRYQDQVTNSHLKPISVIILGHKVMCVNATTQFSEIAGALAEKAPFGVAWFRRQDGKFQFSLRSCNDGVDVSQIAKHFGGGGHRNAAGFELTIDQVTPFFQMNQLK